VVVFPKGDHDLGIGDYVWVKAVGCTQATLLGEIVGRELTDESRE
jgi:hypothetical protein